MQAKVTEKGVLVPKQWLEGIDQVEIHREGDRIVLVPSTKSDPIWDLGSNPTNVGVSDASENLDHHIYGSA